MRTTAMRTTAMRTTAMRTTAMRTTALEGLAICDPARAFERATEYHATGAELRYLDSILQQLGTRLDRYVGAAMRVAANRAAKSSCPLAAARIMAAVDTI